MSEKVAIVGSRKGADLEQTEQFTRALYAKHPDTILVSGGADGVDKVAEQTWLELGGRVLSYRVRQLAPERFVAEAWRLGGNTPSVSVVNGHPTFADRTSCLFYRNMLIAEAADRVVAFFRRLKSPGAGSTIDFAKAYGKLTYEYEATS